MMKQLLQQQKGFALLYTVVVISLILTIAISISNISYKQTVLSSLAKDSQIAFYQADGGVECALYYDVTVGSFPRGTPLGNAPGTITCGQRLMILESDKSTDDYFVYEDKLALDTTDPCFTIVFDKVTDPTLGIIQSRGHNSCKAGPRQVERALEVRY